MSKPVLKSYISRKQESIDAYLEEWQSINRSQINTNGNEIDEDRDEQGIYTNSEAIWLEKLGFGNYVSQLETGDGGEGTEDALLTNAGLSKHYAHTIRRRMNTLRSTVKSRRKKTSEEALGREDGRNDSTGYHHTRGAASPTHVGSKVSRAIRSSNSPRASPRASPTPSRRSIGMASERLASRRNKNSEYNIDSGVYSASSSRDGTPVRGGQQAGEGSAHPPGGGSSETNVRLRTNVLSHSPKHRSRRSSSEQTRRSSSESNGVHGPRHMVLGERGEGVYLDNDMSTRISRIDPVALNLVSKSIEPSAEGWRPDSLDVGGGSAGRTNPRVMTRSLSEKPSSSTNGRNGDLLLEGGNKREAKSLLQGRNVRSVSPLLGHDSALASPEDVKLDFGSSISINNGSGILGPDGMQELPNFMISPDALGITRICDLSHRDMEKVRSVALLELTVTFDDHDIPLRSRRPARAKNYAENALRGVPLSMLLQADQKRDQRTSIPLIFEEMISYLETHALEHEGLLRVPGSTSRINSLMQDLEAFFQSGHFTFSGCNPNDVCSLLKQFIRELPVPLLTRDYLPAFASIADINGLKEQVRTLNLLILLLPDVHQRVLKRLLEFFEKIAQHSSSNKMDMTNVAMVIAPNLFIRLPTRHNLDDVTMVTKTSHVVRLLIKYHNLLWTIPGEMLRQIRYLYENEVRRLNPRSVQKAIKQMQHQLMEQQPSRGITTPEVSHHIIRVKAPLFTRVCMAVDICVGVTAGDIITKLQKKSRLNHDVIRKKFSNSVELPVIEEANKLKLPEEVMDAGEQFLFEVGGNIGERCLPNNTDMYSLYSVNSQAQWVIKPRDCPDLN